MRVNQHHARAAPLRLLDEGDGVRMGGGDVRAPDNHHLRLAYLFGVVAVVAANRVLHRRLACGRADGAIQQAGAHAVEQAIVHAAIVDDAHRASVAVGQHRLRPMLGDHPLEVGDDGGNRLIPTDALELAPWPFRAVGLAPHWIQHAVGAVDALIVAVGLGAEEALSQRVVRVAADAHYPPILDVGKH